MSNVLAVMGAIVIAGCGGDDEGGDANGLGGAVESCLSAAGFEHNPSLATVGLEGAEAVFASDKGVTIYTTDSEADAKRIAASAQASPAEGSVGSLVYLSGVDDAAKVKECLGR